MRVALPAGAPCASGTIVALEREGFRVVPVAPDATRLPPCEAVVLTSGAGGLLGALARAAGRGLPLLAFGDGFAFLCEAGLLPGRLGPAAQELVCRMVHLRVEGKPTAFTAAIPAGRLLRLPLVSTRPRYTIDSPGELATDGRVLLRYCDPAGGLTPSSDPTGSDACIAGICSAGGNVVGMAPHIDRDALLGGHGRQFLAALRLHLRMPG